MTSFPQCVLFDLDGTLLDSLPGLEFSVREAFADEPEPVDIATLPSLIGPPIRSILSSLRPSLAAERLDALESRFRQSYDSEGWRKTTYFPDAANVLRRLSESGRRLFVVSNKPQHIAMKILESEKVLSLFDEVYTRDSRVPSYSDKAEMITTIAQKFELAPEAMLLVGDTIEDAEAALATGTDFVLMTHGYGHAGLEEHSGPVQRCSGFAEWLPILAEEKAA